MPAVWVRLFTLCFRLPVPLATPSPHHLISPSTVVTGTVKSMVRGPGEGLTVTVSLLGVYKSGGLDLPSPPSDTPLKLHVPCRQMPPMKKGRGMGSGGRCGAPSGPAFNKVLIT